MLCEQSWGGTGTERTRFLWRGSILFPPGMLRRLIRERDLHWLKSLNQRRDPIESKRK